MKLKIASEISLSIPQLLLGIITVKNSSSSRVNSAIPQLIRGAIASKQKELAKEAPEGRESVALWKSVDKQPHILQLLHTVEENEYLTFGNALEDLALYFSVRYEVPILSLDLDEVYGDIELCRASGGEPFRPRSTIKLEHPDTNEIIYRDRSGVVSCGWSKEISQRVALTSDSRNAAWFIETVGNITVEKMKSMLKEMEKAIRTYCGGNVEMAIIGDTVTEIDLGVAGTTGINDAEYKPDSRRLAFHQKLLENFEKMKKMKGGISISAKGEKKKKISVDETPKIAEPTPEKEITAPEAEKSIQPPAEEKQLPPPPTEEKLLPSKTESSLIEMLTRKFMKGDTKNTESPLLSAKIQQLLKNAIKKAFPDAHSITDIEPFIEQAKDFSHGDFASNVAMSLSKQLKKAPQQIANAILEHIEKPDFLEKVEFAQPGFINFTLSVNWIESELPKIISRKSPLVKPEIGNKKPVLVEYSSPNIAKPLGVHHLLSTIIGQALYNIFSYLEYKTVAINHIGDWGTQFGKLTVSYKLWGDKKSIEKDPIEELLKLYVHFHDVVEKDPVEGEKLEQQARDEFKKLEDGDKENTKLWQWFVAMSLKDTQKTYDALQGIHFDKIQGESFYSDKMDDILKEGKEKGIFETGEEGAIVVKFENEKLPPFLVQKSDGATLYGTRDLAAAKYRLKTWHPEKVLYVVDTAQSLHFQQLFETARKLQWHSGAVSPFVHVSFGRMRFEDEKMSTRKGNILRLNEVLMEAVERAKKIVAQKSPDIPEKRHGDLARIIGIGAVKYNILSQNRTTDIVFQWDKILSLDGNSAPYLQYTHARAGSILKKATTERRREKKKAENQFTLFEAISSQESSETDPSVSSQKTNIERELARQLAKFSEAVVRSSEEYRPNIITNYLYETAKLFNTFYHEVSVLQAESESLRNFRLQLTQATKVILHDGLALVGVEVPEEM